MESEMLPLTRLDQREYRCKVVVLGDAGVGKTSIIQKYCKNAYSPNYRATIGADFTVKTLEWNPKTLVTLNIWDMAGERRRSATRLLFRDASGIFIVYDISRPRSLEECVTWKNDFDENVSFYNDRPVPCVLLANKCDMAHQFPVNKKGIREFCQRNGFTKFFETSAIKGEGLREAFEFLICQMIMEEGRGKSINKNIRLTGEEKHSGNRNCCC